MAYEVHHEENITQMMEFQNRKHVNDGKKKIFLEAPNLEPSKALVEKEDDIKNEILELKSTIQHELTGTVETSKSCQYKITGRPIHHH